MVGTELIVGYLCGWLVRKVRRVGERVDGQVDAALDDAVDRLGCQLHELVAARLDGDPALEQLSAQAAEGELVSARTWQRVVLALEEVIEQDPVFAAAARELVGGLLAAGVAPVPSAAGVGSLVVHGAVGIEAEGGALAAGVINGAVHVQNPPVPGLL